MRSLFSNFLNEVIESELNIINIKSIYVVFAIGVLFTMTKLNEVDEPNQESDDVENSNVTSCDTMMVMTVQMLIPPEYLGP